MGDGYSGWSNYETWRIANDVLINTMDAWQRNGERYDTVDELADALEQEIESLIDDDNGNGFAVSLARSFVDDVNWREIAESAIDELTRENWIECDECGDMFPGKETTEQDIDGVTGTYCHDCAEELLGDE